MFLELKKSGEVPPPLAPEPWQEVLFDAADLLERRGWCQKHLVDIKGRRCIIGAMTDVWNVCKHWDMSVVAQAQNKLTEIVGPVVEWNDAEGRTKEEVVGILRYAAALL